MEYKQRIIDAYARGCKVSQSRQPRQKKPIDPDNPPERVEMARLATYLDERFGYMGWMHAPNEGCRSVRQGAILKSQGMKAGVPDVLIFHAGPWGHGIAIELKRIKGSYTSESQREWIAALTTNGWAARVCNGCNEAIKYIEALTMPRGIQ